MEGAFLGVAIVMIVMVVAMLLSGVKIVQPYEQAIYMRLGKYVRVLNQGLNFVCPLRSIIGEMELDQILSSRERINVSLRDILDENTDKWGVKIEAVEIREVDPARKVKDSMEEQTSAERKRRAAILELSLIHI